MNQRNEKIWGTAGCGKTTELLKRINGAVEFEKSEICVVTYRKNMANELKLKLGWSKQEGFFVGTLHSVCLKLLRDYKINIFTEEHLKDFCEKNGFNYCPEVFCFDNITTKNYSKIRLIVNCSDMLNEHQLEPEHIGSLINPIQWNQFGFPPEEYLIKFIKLWNSYRIENDVFMFSDLIKVIFEKKIVPDTKMLVVDEFQDLTPLQFAVIKMWSNEMRYNLIAGDPLQCIYKYNGANPKFFKEFCASETVLPISYRLPKVILDFSKHLISRGTDEFPAVDSNIDGGNISVLSKISIKNKIKLFKNDCFHLVRCNYLMDWIVETLTVEGIPFKTNIEGVGWNKSTVGLFNLILNLRKSFNLDKNFLSADDFLLLLGIFPQEVFSLKKSVIKKDIARGTALDISYLFNAFSAFFSESGGIKGVIFSNDPFSVSLKKVKSNQKRLVSLALLKNSDFLRLGDISVVVSTIHGVKGLESDTVFLYNDVPKRILSASFSISAFTDELRVWFVGVTRARKNLFLVKGVLGSKNVFSF